TLPCPIAPEQALRDLVGAFGSALSDAIAVPVAIVVAALSTSAGSPSEDALIANEVQLNPDGTPRQIRVYGPDGYPQTDIDFSHDHDQGVPHALDWGRPSEGGKPESQDRGPGRPLKPGDPGYQS